MFVVWKVPKYGAFCDPYFPVYDLKTLSKWFRINSFQANPGKFQFMILGKKKRNSVKLMINSNEIEESKRVVLLGIKIDNPLNFDEHINNLCPSTLITIGRELQLSADSHSKSNSVFSFVTVGQHL